MAEGSCSRLTYFGKSNDWKTAFAPLDNPSSTEHDNTMFLVSQKIVKTKNKKQSVSTTFIVTVVKCFSMFIQYSTILRYFQNYPYRSKSKRHESHEIFKVN